MAKTINTELRKMIEENRKLSTSVKNIDLRLTDNSSALVMNKETALELAEKIITFAHIIEEEKRINLTFIKNENRVTITSY